MAEEINFADFGKVDIRAGRILTADPFPEARKPAYKLRVDFGPDLGEKQTSAQITANYSVAELPGRLVLAVVNLSPKRVAGFMSEVLVLGVPDEAGGIVLLSPEREVPPGSRMY